MSTEMFVLVCRLGKNPFMERETLHPYSLKCIFLSKFNEFGLFYLGKVDVHIQIKRKF